MNVKKLMDNYIKDNPVSSMIKYYKNINNLMGRYIITKVDRPTMMKLLLQLDYYKYETGYAIANERLLLHADLYRNKKLNLRQHFHITSSTLFNVLEGRRVSIEFAVEFCKLNNLKVKDNFNMIS